MRLPGTFLNQSSDTKIKVKIGQNLKIKSTVKGLRSTLTVYRPSRSFLQLTRRRGRSYVTKCWRRWRKTPVFGVCFGPPMRLTSTSRGRLIQRRMCSGEVRSPLRLPRHPYMQPNVLCSGEVRSPLRLPRHPLHSAICTVFWGSVKPTEVAQTPLLSAKCSVFWGSEKPTEAVQTPLHAAKCTVFWGSEKPTEATQTPFTFSHMYCVLGK